MNLEKEVIQTGEKFVELLSTEAAILGIGIDVMPLASSDQFPEIKEGDKFITENDWLAFANWALKVRGEVIFFISVLKGKLRVKFNGEGDIAFCEEDVNKIVEETKIFENEQ